MALALEARAMADDILIGDTPKAVRRRGRVKGARAAGRVWKHSTLADARGLLPDAVMDALRPVMLVRNPWARMVSYYHWSRGQDFDHPAVAVARDTDFAGFVAHPTVAEAVRRTPYTRYVAGGTAPIFIRIEHLPTDLVPFEALLGFRLDLPHVNRSDRPADWRAAYGAETRAQVADICAEDIARFGYRFGEG